MERDVTATEPDRLWLTDITEHGSSEGRLCLGAINDVLSHRIVGDSIADRMTAELAVVALSMGSNAADPSGRPVEPGQFRSRRR